MPSPPGTGDPTCRSEEHTSELQSRSDLVCRLLLEKKFMLVDGEFASIGTANFDDRSLDLNFEVNCLIYDPQAVAGLEEHFCFFLIRGLPLKSSLFPSRPLFA